MAAQSGPAERRARVAGIAPGVLPLTELVLDNRPPDRSLRGIERLTGLSHVEFFGTPAPEELAALHRLPVLASLTVHQPDTVADLVRLPALRRLAVDGIPPARRPAVLATLEQADHLAATVDGVAFPACPLGRAGKAPGQSCSAGGR